MDVPIETFLFTLQHKGGYDALVNRKLYTQSRVTIQSYANYKELQPINDFINLPRNV